MSELKWDDELPGMLRLEKTTSKGSTVLVGYVIYGNPKTRAVVFLDDQSNEVTTIDFDSTEDAKHWVHTAYFVGRK